MVPSPGAHRSRGTRAVAARVAAVMLLAAGCPHAAHAAEDTSDAARQLAREGRAAFVGGDYAYAVELFRSAYSLLPAPTILEYEARALEKAGKLVEAAETYERTTRTVVASGSPEQFQRAVEDAAAELAALEPRIPRFVLEVTGGAAADPSLTLTLDGAPLPLRGAGAPPWRANPGDHRVIARVASGSEATVVFFLREGETQHVGLAVRTLAPDPAEQRPQAPAPNIERRETTPNTMKIVAYTALGVGVAGLGTGIIAGSLSVARHADAERECPDDACVVGTAGARDLDAFRTLRTVSTVGYVVGAAAGGTGLVLLLTGRSSPRRASTGGLRPWVGFGAVGVRGAF